MLKFVVVLHRRVGMTGEQFRDYFRRVHGPMAEKLPGLRRYVRNFPLPSASRKPPSWDAIVELYFDSSEAMEAAWASEEGKQATDDLPLFADLSKTTWSVVEEDKISPCTKRLL